MATIETNCFNTQVYESDGVRSRSISRSSALIAEVSAQSSSSSATYSSLHSECCAALLVGDALSKPVHIRRIVAPLSEDSDSNFLRDTSTSSEPLHAPGHLPHYCVHADASTNGQDTQSAPSTQIEPAGAASSTSSVVYEDVHACTLTTIDEDAGGGIGCTCINIVTLCSVWSLTAVDTDNTDSTDDLFMIPIEESLIGQQSSLHELVID